MHTEPRNGASIDRIYLHTNEGPQVEGGATQLANYLTTIDGGYHVIVDDAHTVYCAADSQVVWAEGGDNTHALSVCMIGFSASTDWNSDYSKAMVERAAQQVATWCKAYNIPTLHVTGAPGQAPTERGIAEHADDHNPASQGHTDPGSAFPLGLFLIRVHVIMDPTPVDWAALARLVQWEKNVTDHPLKAGESHPGVVILKQQLKLRGFHTEPGEFYGQLVSNGVASLKAKFKLANRQGEVAGGDFVHALLTRPL